MKSFARSKYTKKTNRCDNMDKRNITIDQRTKIKTFKRPDNQKNKNFAVNNIQIETDAKDINK